jgi:hypothetical protein
MCLKSRNLIFSSVKDQFSLRANLGPEEEKAAYWGESGKCFSILWKSFSQPHGSAVHTFSERKGNWLAGLKGS